MNKKALCILMALSMAFLLSGCWSYRGLNELTIVSGIGIDRNPDNGDYHIVYEIADLATSSEKSSVEAKLIESEGPTIFQAVRNAKKRLTSKLYFGNAQVIVVGNQLAEDEGLSAIVDWFLRNEECRETMSVVISQEKTAKEILAIKGIANSLVANEIKSITALDQKSAASTRDLELYKIYNIYNGEGICLVLPAIHCVLNDEDPAVEVNGLAVFKQKKMIGYLDPVASKFYLFAVNQVKGGILTIPSNVGRPDDVSLEVTENKTKTSYSYEDGKLKFVIKINTKVYLEEAGADVSKLDADEITRFEKITENKMIENVTGVIKKVQSEYGSDIFGFGSLIYKKEPKLWDQLSPQWDYLFKTMDIEVQSKVTIINTSSLKKK